MPIAKWNRNQQLFYRSLFQFPETYEELQRRKDKVEKFSLLPFLFGPFRNSWGWSAAEKARYRKHCASLGVSVGGAINILWISLTSTAPNVLMGGLTSKAFLGDLEGLIGAALNADVAADGNADDDALCEEITIRGFVHFAKHMSVSALKEVIERDLFLQVPREIITFLVPGLVDDPRFNHPRFMAVIFEAMKAAKTIDQMLEVWKAALPKLEVTEDKISQFMVLYRKSLTAWEGLFRKVLLAYQEEGMEGKPPAYDMTRDGERVNYLVHMALGKEYFHLTPVAIAPLPEAPAVVEKRPKGKAEKAESAVEAAAVATAEVSVEASAEIAAEEPKGDVVIGGAGISSAGASAEETAETHVLLVSSRTCTETVTMTSKGVSRKLTNKKLREMKAVAEAGESAKATGASAAAVRKGHRSFYFPDLEDGYHSEPGSARGGIKGGIKEVAPGGGMNLFFMIAPAVCEQILKLEDGANLLTRVYTAISSNDIRIEGERRVVNVTGDLRLYADRHGRKTPGDSRITLLFFNELGGHLGSGKVGVDVHTSAAAK